MDMKKIKILLAEDENDLRMLVAEELEKQGYKVYQAADGEEAFALAQEVRPDVVLSDIVMPKKSGNDFLKELRKTDFDKNIPFIVLTARVNMKDYFEVVKVDGFLEKPFKIDELVQKIEHVIKREAEDSGVQKKEIKKPINRSSLNVDIAIGAETEGILDIDMAHSIEDIPNSRKESEKVYKVLLAEDDVHIYTKLEKIFFKNKFLIRVVRSPSKCLEETISYLPDIIFIKDILCGMRADNLIDLLRGMSCTRDISIIVYGGLELEKIRKEILNKKGSSVLIYDGENQLLERTDALLREMF